MMADSMLPLADVDALSDWIGEPITNEADQRRAYLCLRLASALVRAEVGQNWADGNAPEAASMVTLYSASRVYENREALSRESIDDWTGDRMISEAGAYLTASEKALLAPLRGSRRFGGLGVISTTREEAPSVGGWVPTDTPGVYVPWYAESPW